MEVERAAFPALLPSILKHISTSHFITFDLELSGIPSQKQRTSRQTLAERYQDTKAAAEKFHILQLGITIGEEDVKNERYTLRSYNFNLSPLIYEGLDYERDFTYSSGAVEFLLGHNYHMGAPFTGGIPYLTRDEAVVAEKQTRVRWDRDAIPDIKIRADDTQALEFVGRVKQEIEEWRKTKQPHTAYHDIKPKASPTSTSPNQPKPTELSRFERRLVHQIVRSDYADLRTYSEDGFVRVRARPLDEVSSKDSAKDSLERRIKRAIFHQTGIRWVAEGLAGPAGNLDGIDYGACARDFDGETPAKDLYAFTKRMGDLKDALKARRPVLIGHNCLIDLIYFFRYFYGGLPNTVEEFQELVHGTFPLVVDTKFMATNGSGYFTYRSFQLSQLDEALVNDKSPQIANAKDHPEYLDVTSYHEAGYDSYVTAKVFLKFAMRLAVEAREKRAQDKQLQGKASHEVPAAPAAIPTPAAPTNELFAAVQKKKKKVKQKSKDDAPESKFFSTNMYDLLNNSPNTSSVHNDQSDPFKDDISSMSRKFASLKVQEYDELSGYGKDGLIPRWQSNFWTQYGNKLRVYGTVEEVCDLTAVRKPVDAVARHAGTSGRGEMNGRRETKGREDTTAVTKPSVVGGFSGGSTIDEDTDENTEQAGVSLIRSSSQGSNQSSRKSSGIWETIRSYIST